MSSEDDRSADGTPPASPGTAERLSAVLAADPDAVLAAMGDGVLVPLPDTFPRGNHRTFDGRTGIDLVVAADQPALVDAWARSQREAIVHIDVHFLARPDQLSSITFFDVRDEYGVVIIVLEALDREVVRKSVDVLAAAPVGMARVKKDATSAFVEVDAATTALLGWSAEELIGQSPMKFLHPDDVGLAIEAWMAMRAGRGSGRVRLRFRHADGHYLWLEVSNVDRLDDPEYRGVLSEMVDVSAEMAQLDALRERERFLARLAEILPIGICHLRPDGEVMYSNEPFMTLLGAVDSIDTLMGSVVEADRWHVAVALDSAMRGRAAHVEADLQYGPEPRRCELTFRTMVSDGGGVEAIIVCATDTTDRNRLRAELEHRASHDALTRCLNRAATVTALEQALRESPRVAVAYIDLDQFKDVNDELGHAAGDELLRVAAARLRGVTRADDRLGRLGGDEFVVIWPHADGAADPAALVERLTQAINGDVVFGNRRIHLTASVGAAVSAAGELDAEAVLHRADLAMYSRKRARSRATA